MRCFRPVLLSRILIFFLLLLLSLFLLSLVQTSLDNFFVNVVCFKWVINHCIANEKRVLSSFARTHYYYHQHSVEFVDKCILLLYSRLALRVYRFCCFNLFFFIYLILYCVISFIWLCMFIYHVCKCDWPK